MNIGSGLHHRGLHFCKIVKLVVVPKVYLVPLTCFEIVYSVDARATTSENKPIRTGISREIVIFAKSGQLLIASTAE